MLPKIIIVLVLMIFWGTLAMSSLLGLFKGKVYDTFYNGRRWTGYEYKNKVIIFIEIFWCLVCISLFAIMIPGLIEETGFTISVLITALLILFSIYLGNILLKWKRRRSYPNDLNTNILYLKKLLSRRLSQLKIILRIR